MSSMPRDPASSAAACTRTPATRCCLLTSLRTSRTDELLADPLPDSAGADAVPAPLQLPMQLSQECSWLPSASDSSDPAGRDSAEKSLHIQWQPLPDRFEAIGPCLLRLRRGRSELVPMFAVHGITGLPTLFAALPLACDVYGLRHETHAGREDTLRECKTLAALALKHAQAMLHECERRGSFDFDLIGSSFGGLLAHTVAVAAAELGHAARRMVLLDPSPVQARLTQPQAGSSISMRGP